MVSVLSVTSLTINVPKDTRTERGSRRIVPAMSDPTPSRRLRGGAVLADALVRELLEARLVAVLATFDREWAIHAVPMWYAAGEDAIVLATSSRSRKVRNLERDPRATLVLHDSRPGFEVCGASIAGTVEIVRHGERAAARRARAQPVRHGRRRCRSRGGGVPRVGRRRAPLSPGVGDDVGRARQRCLGGVASASRCAAPRADRASRVATFGRGLLASRRGFFRP